MTDNPTQKPNDQNPKDLVFANLGGLPKFVQDMIDKNKNQVPDFLERLDLKDIQIDGKTFSSWNEVIAEFKRHKQGSAPISIKFKGKELNEKVKVEPAMGKTRTAPKDLSQIMHQKKQKPVKIGGGFLFIKILLAIVVLGVIIYYIYKYAS